MSALSLLHPDERTLTRPVGRAGRCQEAEINFSRRSASRRRDLFASSAAIAVLTGQPLNRRCCEGIEADPLPEHAIAVGCRAVLLSKT
jgi:hypothetical protein